MTTTDRLKAMLDERHAAGLAKYRTTVDRDDLTPTQWAQHAIEEMLDGAAYLMRLKDTIETLERRIEELEAKNRDLQQQLKTKGNQ
jgi:polyhydroxyalkanoate synthesis regulator phasin